MNLKPDWEALGQLNFLLAPRIEGLLNEALNAIELSGMENNSVDPKIWRAKAKAAIANLLNMYQAWSMLVQYHTGAQLPPHAVRSFSIQSLLDWLSVQLELMPPAKAPEDINLQGLQACLQEALLLLYSVASTQGSAVHMTSEIIDNGAWFRIRFSRPKPMPTSIDAVIQAFDAHWRSQDAAFEIKTARDFIALSGSAIQVNWIEDEKLGEFSFFVLKEGVDQSVAPSTSVNPDAEHAQIVANVTRSMLVPVEATNSQDKPAEEEPPKHESSETQPSTVDSESKALSPGASEEKGKGIQLLEDLREMDASKLEPMDDDEDTQPLEAASARRETEKRTTTKIVTQATKPDLKPPSEDPPTPVLKKSKPEEHPNPPEEEDTVPDPTAIPQPLKDKKTRIVTINLPEPEMPTLLRKKQDAAQAAAKRNKEKEASP